MRRTIWIIAKDSVLSVSLDVEHLQGCVWRVVSEHGSLGQPLLERQCVYELSVSSKLQLSLGREKRVPRQTQTRTESAPLGTPFSEVRLPRRDTQIV